MTASTLRTYTAKDLGQMARQHGVAGWHSMRKEELVRVLTRLHAKGGGKAQKKKPSETQKRLDRVRQAIASSRQSELQANADTKSDRLVVMVRDPYWLHAYWELTPSTVSRARAAMGQRWHGAHPVLRVFRLKDRDLSVHERDIRIHGGVSHWYIDVADPPASYRLEIGYRTDTGDFYSVARSNPVTTPAAGTSDSVDENWTDIAQQADRIYAMSGGYSEAGASRELQELLEERLQRPLGSPMNTRYGAGAASMGEEMRFAVDAEITVFGVANPGSHVTLKGEPVQVREDGSFAVRLALPEQRQVIPVVASSSDGVEQRTTILAIERNTKAMEPLVRDITRP